MSAGHVTKSAHNARQNTSNVTALTDISLYVCVTQQTESILSVRSRHNVRVKKITELTHKYVNMFTFVRYKPEVTLGSFVPTLQFTL